MWLGRVGFVRAPVGRARVASVGVAVLGAVGLGLAVVPACGGGGGIGDDVAPVALAVSSGSVAPNAQGGGGAGDDAVHWPGSAVRVAPDCGGGGGVGSDD